MKHFYSFLLLLFVSLSIHSQATDFVTGLNNPRDLLIYEGELYFTERGTARIAKVDLSLSNPVPVTVLGGIAQPYGLALKGTELYFSQGPGFDRISKIDISEPNPTPTVVAEGISFPIALAIKGDDLYIAQFYQGKVSKIDITTPNPTVIEVAAVNTPYALEFKNNDLYVAGYSANKISKINVANPYPIAINVVTGLALPVGLSLYGKELYIAEAGRSIGNDIISKINTTSQNPSTTTAVTGLYNPLSGLANYNGVLYIAEDFKISKFDLPPLSLEDFDVKNIIIYPNPTFDYVKISGLINAELYKIYSISGTVLDEGIISANEKISVQHLSTGTYFLILNDSKAIKIVKK